MEKWIDNVSPATALGVFAILLSLLGIIIALQVSCTTYPEEKIADNETCYAIRTDGYVYYVKSYSVDSHNCVNFIYGGLDKMVCGTYRITKYLPKNKVR